MFFNLIFIFGNRTSYLQCVVFQINLFFQIGLNTERQGAPELAQEESLFRLLLFILPQILSQQFCMNISVLQMFQMCIWSKRVSLLWTEKITSPGFYLVILGLFDGNGSCCIWTYHIRASWNHRFCPTGNSSTVTFVFYLSSSLDRIPLSHWFHLG